MSETYVTPRKASELTGMNEIGIWGVVNNCHEDGTVHHRASWDDMQSIRHKKVSNGKIMITLVCLEDVEHCQEVREAEQKSRAARRVNSD